MLSPKIIPNEYFFTGKPNSLLEQLNNPNNFTQLSPRHPNTNNRKFNRIQSSVNRYSRDRSKASVRSSRIQKDAEDYLRSCDFESMYIPQGNNANESGYAEILQALESKQKTQAHENLEKKKRVLKNGINYEYFGKEILED